MTVPAIICVEPNLTNFVKNEFEQPIQFKFGIEDDDDEEEEEINANNNKNRKPPSYYYFFIFLGSLNYCLPLLREFIMSQKNIYLI